MRAIAIVAIVVLISGAAAAQDVEIAKQKLLAKRAAEADAYRKLAEAVYGLQINSTTFVQDFATESDEIRTAVDQFVKGVRLGEPVWYDDGSCEVPAEVTVAKVIETIRSAYDRHYEGDRVKSADFESISKRIEKQVIKAVGMGAPREDLPPNLPAGTLEQLPPLPDAVSARSGPPPVPEIWRRIGPRARLMAQRAAEVDAKRQLAERIKGLRLTSRTQVRDFAAESDTITTELNATLVGAEPISVYYHANELIAEVTCRVPTEQIITAIKRLHSRHYKGDDVRGQDIEKIVRRVVKKDFEATGMGVPTERYIRQYEQKVANTPAAPVTTIPEWATGRIVAVGQGTDDRFNTAQGRLKAARAAEVDAKRKLGEMIAGLQINSDTVVNDFATEHDHISAAMNAFLVGAVIEDTTFSEDIAQVRVSLPGMRVWEVVHEQMRRNNRNN